MRSGCTYLIEKIEILSLILTVAKFTALLIFCGVSGGMWVGSVDEKENKVFRNIYFTCSVSKLDRLSSSEPCSDFSVWCGVATVGTQKGAHMHLSDDELPPNLCCSDAYLSEISGR